MALTLCHKTPLASLVQRSLKPLRGAINAVHWIEARNALDQVRLCYAVVNGPKNNPSLIDPLDLVYLPGLFGLRAVEIGMERMLVTHKPSSVFEIAVL
jgi:hypothetical protein